MNQVYVHAPDDLILNKVHYYSISRQSKHIRDIASIVVSPDVPIDWEYFDDWLQRLDLEATWQEVSAKVAAIIGASIRRDR